MKIKNYTDIPTETIREIIRIVRPPGISNFDVRVSNSRKLFYGRAYSHGSSLHHTDNPFIVIRITRDESKFPRTTTQESLKKGYRNVYLASRLEAVVHLIAHELRHLWQDKYPYGKRLGGGRGKFSEVDADTYASLMLNKWRGSHGLHGV